MRSDKPGLCGKEETLGLGAPPAELLAILTGPDEDLRRDLFRQASIHPDAG